MLYMVIEHFKGGDARRVGERFRAQGRMLPEGVVYRASWMTADGARCFQFMESPGRELLDEWIARWSDLVDFEVHEVLVSSEYWAKAAAFRGVEDRGA